MKKRILSLLLTLCMALSLLPVSAAAEEEELYLALGDSISAGYGISDADKRFTNIVAAERGYTLVNHAVNGNTVAGINDQFDTGELDEDIAAADFITVTVGGNDMLDPVFVRVAEQYNLINSPDVEPDGIIDFMTSPSTGMTAKIMMFAAVNTVLEGDKNNPPYAETEEFAKSLEALQDEIYEMIVYIRRLNTTANIVLTTQYHPYRTFGALSSALNYRVDDCAMAFRKAVYESAEECGFLVADVYTAFKGRETELCNAKYVSYNNMDLDFHPNAAGHAVIAQTVLAVELPEVPTLPEMPHEHAYDEGVVTTAPTCTEDGVKTFTCECGDSYTVAVPATGHSESIQVQEPTCTSEGIEIRVCLLCGRQENVILPMLPHTPEVIPAVEATCTETGLTAGEKCSVCGTVTVEPQTAPAKGHTYDNDQDTECNDCGHIRDITCTHSWDGGTVILEPTCTAEGGKFFVCALCGETKTEILAPLGHSEVILPAVEATCTETGLTEGKKCSVCGEVITAQQTVSAKGHVYSSDRDTTCNVCGEKREVEKPSGGGSSGGGGGSSVEYYTISASATKGGSVSPSGKVSIAEGRDRVFTFKADSGYVISDVKVDGKSEGAVSRYTFEDVEEDHTITVTFRPEKCDGGSSCPSRGYTDLNSSAWYHDAVDAMLAQGLMKGSGSKTFSPDASLSRSMLVVMLYRLEGEPAVSSKWNVTKFKDVSSSAWYADAVAWASAMGIVSGYDAKTFAPNVNINREQLATILYRYARYKKMDVSIGESSSILQYKDVSSVSGYAVVALQWALSEGIISGMPGSVLAPKAPATRAQAAKVVYSMM